MMQPVALIARGNEAGQRPWWLGATIYQIYPRSFLDTDGDGVGDLKGITEKLDYVAGLGVDAIWVSPFFTSPMLDFGYDVSAFRDVDPIFGTLADFDAMIAKAHALGIKVIVDQVYSHSSDQHRWFKESRASRDNPRADWYVWADPRPDGTPPNNWQSIFGGPAWTWDARRRQYYFHNFLPQQPDLNLHNPAVRAELLDVGRFWLERGVDGMRFDAVLHMMHDPGLADNPPSSDPAKDKARGHDFQDNIHNQGHPAIFDFLEDLRAMMDEYGAIFSVAEVGGSGVREFTKACAAGHERLNSAYGFDYLYAPDLTAELVCASQNDWPEADGIGWPTWAFENHDARRAVSRWDTRGDKPAFLRFKMALLTALRGNIILYQGEELGLEQVDIPFEKVKDPEALRNWPLTLSRDGARTPMPWDKAAPNAGFSTGEPWLPVGIDNAAKAVAGQDADAGSMLAFTRAMLRLRNGHPALRYGTADCRVEGELLVLERAADGEALTWLFNFGRADVDIAARAGGRPAIASVNGGDAGQLPPLGAVLLGE